MGGMGAMGKPTYAPCVVCGEATCSGLRYRWPRLLDGTATKWQMAHGLGACGACTAANRPNGEARLTREERR